MMPPTCLLCLLSPFNRLSARRCVFAFPVSQKSALRDVNRDFAKLHSIAETAMKNGNSKFNAILAVVQQ